MSGIQKFKLKARASQTSSRPEASPATAQPPVRDADPIVVAMEQASAEVPMLLLPRTVGEMLGLTERTLERWRITGEGPRYVKLSRSTVRYLAEDVAAFIAASLRANTAQVS
ncbi:helix-turn-helix transcriptional regulator [Sphingomonas beigongshangi]|uniref:helix-turn-helix transcriptional regulator n=1 Tax=Sphingomonas beigongshangi TaxID=2782540 RepID=UPI00193B4C11|nr:hypothetical protein [Sphingomonas beigongshangi]